MSRGIVEVAERRPRASGSRRRPSAPRTAQWPAEGTVRVLETGDVQVDGSHAGRVSRTIARRRYGYRWVWKASRVDGLLVAAACRTRRGAVRALAGAYRSGDRAW